MTLLVVMVGAELEISAPDPVTNTSAVPTALSLLKLMRPDEAARVPLPTMLVAVLTVFEPEMVKMPALICNVLSVLLPLRVVVPVEAEDLVRVPSDAEPL